MHQIVDLHIEPQEASGLVLCEAPAVRDQLGLEPAFWTVLDEGPVDDCVALIAQTANTSEPTANWTTMKLKVAVTTPSEKTDDCEAIAGHDGWMYVFGSAYGSKGGPLQKKRSFVSRFHESDVRVTDKGNLKVDMHVASAPFLLHQLINDALKQSATPLFAWSPAYQEGMVLEARRKAIDKGHAWASRLACDDSAVNIEGACFTAEGHLLLGLRVPVTRYGEPLVVELRHPERLFDPAQGDPVPGRVFALMGIASREVPLGIRDLHLDRASGELHALVGNLDSRDKGSLLLAEHPEAALSDCYHVKMRLPAPPKTARAKAARALSDLRAEVVYHFDGLYRVEGLAADADGQFLYVSDEEDKVRTHFFTEE